MSSCVVNLIPNKRRHRIRIIGKHAQAYMDEKTKAEEAAVAASYSGEFHEGAVRVEIHTYKALPKSKPKRIERERDTSKPDIDNIAKAVLDGLNGIAYEDDSQVVELRIVKHDRTRKAGDSIRYEVVPIPGNENL